MRIWHNLCNIIAILVKTAIAYHIKEKEELYIFVGSKSKRIWHNPNKTSSNLGTKIR